MKRFGFLLVMAVFASALIVPVATASDDENTLIELMRSDVQKEKKEIIAEAMELTDAQAAAFWPVYNKYDFDLRKVYDERLAIMKDYAAVVQNITDEQAAQLVKRSLKTEGQLTSLKSKYYKEFSKAVGAKTAGRFLQYESTLLRIIDLKLGLVGLAIPEAVSQSGTGAH